MLRATQDRAQLEEYIGPESVLRNPRNENNFVFLLKKEIRKWMLINLRLGWLTEIKAHKTGKFSS
jgi:hypothetical protein